MSIVMQSQLSRRELRSITVPAGTVIRVRRVKPKTAKVGVSRVAIINAFVATIPPVDTFRW